MLFRNVQPFRILVFSTVIDFYVDGIEINLYKCEISITTPESKLLFGRKGRRKVRSKV